jgi:transcriptional regulator with XRE-family HTH domain
MGQIPSLFPREEFIDIRLRLRLTQSQLANLLGVTEMTIRRWENRRSVVPKTVGLAMLYLNEHYTPNYRKSKLPKGYFSDNKKSEQATAVSDRERPGNHVDDTEAS